MDGNSPAVHSNKLHEKNYSSASYSVYSRNLTFVRNSTGNLVSFLGGSASHNQLQ